MSLYVRNPCSFDWRMSSRILAFSLSCDLADNLRFLRFGVASLVTEVALVCSVFSVNFLATFLTVVFLVGDFLATFLTVVFLVGDF